VVERLRRQSFMSLQRPNQITGAAGRHQCRFVRSGRPHRSVPALDDMIQRPTSGRSGVGLEFGRQNIGGPCFYRLVRRRLSCRSFLVSGRKGGILITPENSSSRLSEADDFSGTAS